MTASTLTDEHSSKKTEKSKVNSETRSGQVQFANFTEMLKELQRKGKISAEEYRNYGWTWREQPQNRETLVQQLKLLLDK